MKRSYAGGRQRWHGGSRRRRRVRTLQQVFPHQRRITPWETRRGIRWRRSQCGGRRQCRRLLKQQTLLQFFLPMAIDHQHGDRLGIGHPFFAFGARPHAVCVRSPDIILPTPPLQRRSQDGAVGRRKRRGGDTQGSGHPIQHHRRRSSPFGLASCTNARPFLRGVRGTVWWCHRRKPALHRPLTGGIVRGGLGQHDAPCDAVQRLPEAVPALMRRLYSATGCHGRRRDDRRMGRRQET